MEKKNKQKKNKKKQTKKTIDFNCCLIAGILI